MLDVKYVPTLRNLKLSETGRAIAFAREKKTYECVT